MIARPGAALVFACAAFAAHMSFAQPVTAIAPAYEDRLIDGGALAPDTDADGGATYNAEGWPRFVRVEGVASYFDQQGLVTRENGARLSARIDTPSYGALSVDATARIAPGSFIATLVQRDFAFDEHWRANNALGVVTSLGIDLTRAQYRFYIPTFPTVGATTEWLRDRDWQLQGSVGQPGNFDGFRLTGFESLNGSMATVGAQVALSPQWQAGVQVLDMRNVDSPYAQPANGTTIDSQAIYAGVSWNGGLTRLQGNFLASDASAGGQSVRANGLWLDGRTLWSGVTHHYGVFRLEPGLTWGYQPINNNIQGAYYRFAYQDLRWQVDGGLDKVYAVSSNGFDGTYYTINGRYQLTTRIGVGGNAGYIDSGGQNAWQATAFTDVVWSQGVSRVQVSVARNNNTPSNDAEQVQLDHTWNMPAGTRLSTTLTATRDATSSAVNGDTVIPATTFRRYAIGVLGGGDITNNVSVDANLQYNVLTRGKSASGVYGNLNLNWRLSPQWSVVGTYYDNRDDTAQLFVLDPLIPVVDPLPTQRNRAVFLSLRYEARAGSPVAALGGRPGSPVGGIGGTLFLDLNDNGRRDPGEPGAANVSILLDGRFATRTDETGRFEFPFVGVGSHRITVVPDNLSLPWTVGDGPFEVRVDARTTSNFDIAARRQR